MNRIFRRALLMALIPTGPWMFGFHPTLMLGTIFLWFASLVRFWLALDRELGHREGLEATVSNLQYLRELEEQFPSTGCSCLFANEPEAVES